MIAKKAEARQRGRSVIAMKAERTQRERTEDAARSLRGRPSGFSMPQIAQRSLREGRGKAEGRQRSRSANAKAERKSAVRRQRGRRRVAGAITQKKLFGDR